MSNGRINRASLRSVATGGLLGGDNALPSLGPPPGTITIVQGNGFIGFKLNGALRWLIDVHRFAGTPSLTTQPTLQHGLTIQLKNARFPGTELPADLVCEIKPRGPLGTPMSLTFTLGGFRADTIFERWLAGTSFLQSDVTLDLIACHLDSGTSLRVAGTAGAQFRPNWIFSLAGQHLAILSGLGSDLISDRFGFQLLFPNDPSLSALPKSRRTLLETAPGSNSWLLQPEPIDLSIGKLIAAPGLFNRIRIEAGEGSAGEVEHVLVANASRADGLQLQLAGDVTGLDGNPFAFHLDAPSYAVIFVSGQISGRIALLVAQFGGDPDWMAADGFALQVGNSPTASFEVQSTDGKETALTCQPALLLAGAPLNVPPGQTAITRPIGFTAEQLLPIVSQPGSAPGWGFIPAPPAGTVRLSLPDFAVSLLRREDLLALTFQFFNLALEGGGGTAAELKVKDPKQPAYVVVQVSSPQNIAEEAFLEVDPPGVGETPGLPPVKKLAAGASRLAFRLPANTTSLPYSFQSLLEWVQLEESVIDTKPLLELRAPLTTETSIEAPWRVILSPEPNETWTHALVPVTVGEWTELWHTRLAARIAQDGQFVADEDASKSVRAVWSPDYDPASLPAHSNVPFRMSLDPNDRDQIVRLSSDYTIPNYQPPAIPAQKLFLSTLGAWMDVQADFDPPFQPNNPVQFNLLQWRHLANMGRDAYVRVVDAGFFCFPGNRAAIIKITERKFEQGPDGVTTAYLRQRFQILTKQPEIDYSFLTPAQQREIPYRKIRIATLITPNLDQPDTFNGKFAFFPKVGGQLFLFHLIGTDYDGNTSEFTTPLFFVEESGDNTVYSHAVDSWQTSGQKTRDLVGQNVAYAVSSKPGGTTFATSNLTFEAQSRPQDPGPPPNPQQSNPPFYPRMSAAAVNVPAIQQVTGQPGAVGIQYFGDYLNNDFGPGGVFVQTLTTLGVGFRGNQSGGVATPNLQVSGLSRDLGTVSGTLNKISSGNFDPADYFSDLNATLFGVIPLKDLIQAIFGPLTVPNLVTERQPDAIQTRLHWGPKVFAHKTYALVTLGFDNPDTALSLDVLIETPLTGGTPQVSISGALKGFTLSLANVIGIKFDSFSFSAPAGQKLDVSVSMAGDGLQFLGDLSFLNELRKYIPSDGFQDPPSLDVTADGVTAGYSLGLPALAVGVFSIENIKLAAALTLPFVPPNPLRFRFAFSERESPFNITVSLLGGGGFFGIAVGPDGVEMLEASIEVGAQCSIDLFVASGSVHIMAGVYLKLDLTTHASQLTGYLRAGGSLDVLGLISVSVEFYLGFTYYFGPPCKIAGEATVTIEIDILFFSVSVQASLRREFSDPVISFSDLIGPADWDYYCDSFAP